MLGWRSLLVEQGCREGGAPQPHLTRLMQGWSSPSSPCKPQLSPVVIRRQTFDPYTWKHDLEGWNWHNLHQDWPFHPQCTWQWFFFFFLTKELAQEPCYSSYPPAAVHTHTWLPQWKPSRFTSTLNHLWVHADLQSSLAAYSRVWNTQEFWMIQLNKGVTHLTNSLAACQR